MNVSILYTTYLCILSLKICVGNLEQSDRFNLMSARNLTGFVYERIEFSALGFNQVLAPGVQCAFACSDHDSCQVFHVESGACVFGWFNNTTPCHNGATYNDGVCECAEGFIGELCQMGKMSFLNARTVLARVSHQGGLDGKCAKVVGGVLNLHKFL